MNPGSFKKILKGIGKNIDDKVGKIPYLADDIKQGVKNKLGANADIANDVGKLIFRKMEPEELEGNFSVAENIFKIKAKTSANVIATLGLTGAGIIAGVNSEQNVEGDIVPVEQYGMINRNTNPILDEEIRRQQNDEAYMQRALEKEMKDYGSAGPDIVFALHELRNR